MSSILALFSKGLSRKTSNTSPKKLNNTKKSLFIPKALSVNNNIEVPVVPLNSLKITNTGYPIPIAVPVNNPENYKRISGKNIADALLKKANNNKTKPNTILKPALNLQKNKSNNLILYEIIRGSALCNSSTKEGSAKIFEYLVKFKQHILKKFNSTYNITEKRSFLVTPEIIDGEVTNRLNTIIQENILLSNRNNNKVSNLLDVLEYAKQNNLQSFVDFLEKFDKNLINRKITEFLYKNKNKKMNESKIELEKLQDKISHLLRLNYRISDKDLDSHIKELFSKVNENINLNWKLQKFLIELRFYKYGCKNLTIYNTTSNVIESPGTPSVIIEFEWWSFKEFPPLDQLNNISENEKKRVEKKIIQNYIGSMAIIRSLIKIPSCNELVRAGLQSAKITKYKNKVNGELQTFMDTLKLEFPEHYDLFKKNYNRDYIQPRRYNIKGHY